MGMVRPEFSHRSLHGAPRGRRRLLIATLLVLLIFVLDTLSGGIVRSATRVVASRIWRGVSLSAAGEYIARQSALVKENARLRDELSRAQERALAYESVRRENDLLKTMLQLAQSSHGLAAPVVSSYRASPYGTFLIGAGRNRGIARDDLVLSDAGFVVGRVADAQDSTSIVRSVFANGSNIDVVVAEAAATARGEGGGNARVSLPRSIDVQSGDAVVSPAYGGRAVGIVGKVEEVSTSAEKIVYISLPVNISTLRYVYVQTVP